MNVLCEQNCPAPYCHHVCPTGAIIVHTNTVYIEFDICIGCGICRYVCAAFSHDKTLECRSIDWLMGRREKVRSPATEASAMTQ